MTKNNMINGLAINQITLDYAFNNLLLVANVIKNPDLLRWVEHEISGYKETDTIPNYRKDEKSTQFMYSMVNNGYTPTNMPLPFSYFSDEVQGEVIYFDILEGIKTIEKMLYSKEQWFLTRDCTIYAPDIYKKSGIACLNLYQVLPKTSYERFYSSVKLNLTKVLLIIEQYFGTLDSAEMQNRKHDKFKVAEGNKAITNYINSMFVQIPRPKAKEIKKTTAEHADINLKQQTPQTQQQPIQQPPMHQVPQIQPPIHQVPQQMHQPIMQPVMPQMPMQPIMPPQYYTQMPPQPIMPQMPVRQTTPVNRAPIISNERQYAETVLPSSFQLDSDGDFHQPKKPEILEKNLKEPAVNQNDQKLKEKEPDKNEEVLKSAPPEESKKFDKNEEPFITARPTKVVVVEEPDMQIVKTPKEESLVNESEEKVELKQENKPEKKASVIESQPEEKASVKDNKETPVKSGIFARISGLKK